MWRMPGCRTNERKRKMRRLPVYLVLDVSESMAGKAIEEVKNGIQLLTDALMSNPYAMETVYISVIAFAGKAKVLTPLTYVLEFCPPELPIGNGTNFSEALNVLMHEIDTNVKKSTLETKGDWKPLIFILTDGTPNDDYRAAAAQWRMKYGKYSTVAVLMGENSDAAALKSVTDQVLVFKETTKESYQAFFECVSDSIQTQSEAVGENGKEEKIDELEKFRRNMAADLLADTLPTENNVDFFVLTARCQKTNKPYIVRYVSRNRGKYVIDGAYPVGEDYFELSSDEGNGKNISGEQMEGDLPPCPHCGNKMLGYCECHKCLCLDPDHLENVKCPFCGSVSSYGGTISSIDGGRG